MPRQGRPPAAESADRLSRAAAIVLAEPAISGAELARRVGVTPSRGVRLLAEIRASVPGLVAPAPSGPGKVVRVPQVVLERLANATGRPVGEDVAGQIVAVLDRVKA